MLEGLQGKGKSRLTSLCGLAQLILLADDAERFRIEAWQPNHSSSDAALLPGLSLAKAV